MDENIILTEENASAFSDDELIEFSRRGEELATATLITRHKGLISKVSRKYFISRGFDQEDFVQEATLAFIKSIKSYSASKGSQFSTFAHLCMENRLRDVVRSYHSINNEAYNATISTTELDGKESERIPDEREIDPLSHAISNETVEKIYSLAKEKLPQKQYAVLMLFFEGYSYTEIKQKLGLDNTKQVDNALSTAKRTLRNLLDI